MKCQKGACSIRKEAMKDFVVLLLPRLAFVITEFCVLIILRSLCFSFYNKGSGSRAKMNSYQEAGTLLLPKKKRGRGALMPPCIRYFQQGDVFVMCLSIPQ